MKQETTKHLKFFGIGKILPFLKKVINERFPQIEVIIKELEGVSY